MTPPTVRAIFAADPALRAAARRYWLHDPCIGLLKNAGCCLIRALPIDWGSNLGAVLGQLAATQHPDSDARARRLWRRLRPEAADEISTTAAMRRLWRAVGRTVAEIAVLDRLWEQGRIEVEGEGRLAALRAAGRPILVAAVHLGNWEVIAVAGSQVGYRGASLALVLENRFDQRLIGRLRQLFAGRFGGRMIHATPTSGRAIVRELQAGGPMVVYIDDLSRGRVHAPAFGRPLKAEGNIAYVVRLAKLTAAAVVPVRCIRQGDRARFKVTFGPAVELIDTGDARADLLANVARLDALIDPLIRAYLDQWFYALDFEAED